MVIKVMLVDDHVLMREGIRQLLEFDGSMKVVDEANNGASCLEKVMKTKADILVLDINLPDMNGIQVLEELRKKKIGIKVMMLTIHNETEYLVRAVEQGVNGYVLKDAEPGELKAAIQAIIRGENYIQPSLIPSLNNRLLTRNEDKEKIESLTKRELEVLVKLSSGMFNRDIAESLAISERTVKNHISNIFKKIDVVDRTQAAVFAIKNDLVKLG